MSLTVNSQVKSSFVNGNSGSNSTLEAVGSVLSTISMLKCVVSTSETLLGV